MKISNHRIVSKLNRMILIRMLKMMMLRCTMREKFVQRSWMLPNVIIIQDLITKISETAAIDWYRPSVVT